MTHEELLKSLHDKWHSTADRQDVFYMALRAVVELHKPHMSDFYGENELVCSHCCTDDFKSTYPCRTIKAIEKALD